ncbi:MAG: hypothetical protein H0Z40_01460 [Desulfotomaculum sp.]|nr:hypothetical protein [Desulfotomaculum sp.]
MAVIIKRFRVRHNGKVYGPGEPEGQIIEGLSKEEEERLIKESRGTIEKYVPPKTAKVEATKSGSDADKKQNSKAVLGKKQTSKKEKQENADKENEILEGANPEELIKPAAKGKKKE